MTRSHPYQARAGEPVLTASQACSILGISRATLHRAYVLGEIRAAFETPGGHRRYLLSEVYRYRDVLAARTNGGPPPPLRRV